VEQEESYGGLTAAYFVLQCYLVMMEQPFYGPLNQSSELTVSKHHWAIVTCLPGAFTVAQLAS
jgi:hypothetical protein